jgi:hypothetical protein
VFINITIYRTNPQKSSYYFETQSDLQENNAYNDNLSLSGGGSSTILDTAELFHANLAIDDNTFQEYSERVE